MSWFGHFRNESTSTRCISGIRRKTTGGTLRGQRVKPVYNWHRQCLYQGMKRCGQWLFMLWVAAALVYPQAATAVSRSHNQNAQLSPSQVQTMPLLADCSFKETGKEESKPCTSPDNSDQIQGEGILRLSRPDMSEHRAQVSTPARPVLKDTRGLLPFVCGPPAQN
jgi:hypothetical protein